MSRTLTTALLTILLVAPLEAVDFYRGTYPGFEVALFSIPIAIALIFYRSWKERLIAWLLLSLLAITTVVAVIVVLWFI